MTDAIERRPHGLDEERALMALDVSPDFGDGDPPDDPPEADDEGDDDGDDSEFPRFCPRCGTPHGSAEVVTVTLEVRPVELSAETATRFVRDEDLCEPCGASAVEILAEFRDRFERWWGLPAAVGGAVKEYGEC
jgi:ribosomal protein S27AE